MNKLGMPKPEPTDWSISGRPVLKQYEMNFLCGLCSVGFDDMKSYLAHIKEEEHLFHKKRCVARLVPGLGFCAACYALMQSELNWTGHIIGLKHKNAVATLLAGEALGVPKEHDQYNEPRCCEVPGVIGPVIACKDINFKMANNYDFGRGGIIPKGTPLVGLGYIVQDAILSRQDMYQCTLCIEKFLFRHRAKHLTGAHHRSKVLERHYPERYANVMSVAYQNLKLIYHCTMVESEEIQSENSVAKALRAKFLTIPERGLKPDVPKEERRITPRNSRARGQGSVGWTNMIPDYSSLLSIKQSVRGLRPTMQSGIAQSPHLSGSSSSALETLLAAAGHITNLNHSSRPEVQEPQYATPEYSGPYAGQGYQDQGSYAQEQASYETPPYYQEQPAYAPEQNTYISPYAQESYAAPKDPNPVQYDPYASEVSGYTAAYPTAAAEDPYNVYVTAKRPPPPHGPPPPHDRKRPSENWGPDPGQKHAKVSKAMAAISILEDFAQSEAGIDVKRKIADIRASVMHSGTM